MLSSSKSSISGRWKDDGEGRVSGVEDGEYNLLSVPNTSVNVLSVITQAV